MRRSNCGFELRIRDGVGPQPSGRTAGVWYDGDGRECGRASVDQPHRWLEWQPAGLFRFDLSDHVVDAWPAEGIEPDGLRYAFVHEVEPLVLQARGWQALHASAVAADGRATAFCGVSGSGKSTIAYAMTQRGRQHVSDDHLIIEVTDEEIQVLPRAFDASLRSASAAHFNTHAVHAVYSSPVCQLTAVAIVQQVADLDEPFVIEPVAPAEAFVALLPHVHCFDSRDRGEMARVTEDYLALVERLPIYRLRYRPSFAVLPRLLDAVDERCFPQPTGA